MPKFYSLENNINEFFTSQASVTRRECDEMATDLFGEPINPILIQGAFSYTVVAGPAQSKIVQFRGQTSLLDVGTLILAREIHPETVVATTFHSTLGGGKALPLSVYVMDKIAGETLVQASLNEAFTAEAKAEARRLTTVKDFAQFFTQSWKGEQNLSSDKKNVLRLQQEQDLELLRKTLPPSFSAMLNQLREGLPLLYQPTFPTVLTHADLSSMNILIDPGNGNITGIVDWADATIQPFGLALWGVLNAMGWMNSEGWHYYSNYKQLEEEFWNTFSELIGGISEDVKYKIRVSSTLGIVLRYGFQWVEGVRRPVTAEDVQIRYLEAFLGGERGGEGLFGLKDF